MHAYITVDDIKTGLAGFGWPLLWTVFLASLFWALFDISEINEQLRDASAKEAQRLRRKRTGICLFVILALLSALSSQWGSELMEDKVRKQAGELGTAKTNLLQVVSKLEKTEQDLRNTKLLSLLTIGERAVFLTPKQ